MDRDKAKILTTISLIFVFHVPVGDGKKPYAAAMQLWDTVTNVITDVPHPDTQDAASFTDPGDRNSFYRPVILTTSTDDSIILIASAIFNNNENDSGPISRMYRYTLGAGWSDEGPLIQENAALEQYGVYPVDNDANSNSFDILSRCSGTGEC